MILTDIKSSTPTEEVGVKNTIFEQFVKEFEEKNTLTYPIKLLHPQLVNGSNVFSAQLMKPMFVPPFEGMFQYFKKIVTEIQEGQMEAFPQNKKEDDKTTKAFPDDKEKPVVKINGKDINADKVVEGKVEKSSIETKSTSHDPIDILV